MLMVIILLIIVVLIAAIIVVMAKIIKGSDEIKEPKSRDLNRAPKKSVKANPESRSPKNSPRSSERSKGEKVSRVSKENKGSGQGRRWKVIIEDVATHEAYEFVFKDALGIGRAFLEEGFDDYLVINDPKVSKLHCSLFSARDNLYIQDEGSSNFTFLNGTRVSESMAVQKEDVIGLGNTELEIVKVFRESK